MPDSWLCKQTKATSTNFAAKKVKRNIPHPVSLPSAVVGVGAAVVVGTIVVDRAIVIVGAEVVVGFSVFVVVSSVVMGVSVVGRGPSLHPEVLQHVATQDWSAPLTLVLKVLHTSSQNSGGKHPLEKFVTKFEDTSCKV